MSTSRTGALLSPMATSLAFLAIVIVCGIALAPRFLTAANLAGVSSGLVAPAVILLAACLAMTGGVTDLSLGSVLGLGGVVYATVYQLSESPTAGVGAAAAAGVAAGLFNGVLSVRFRVWPLIATLGMLVAARGLVSVISGGGSVSAYTPQLSAALKTAVGPIPVALIGVVVLALLVGWVIKRTRWGNHLRAVGGDDVAARRAGIPADRVRLLLFVVVSLVAALAGTLQVMRTGAAAVNLGEGTELLVYGALLISGYRLAGGGRGSALSGLVCLFALELIRNIFRLRGLPLPLTDVLLGLTLIGAVGLDLVRGRVRRPLTAQPATG
ncbi:ABC transporter permease [Nonomuraea wenchangensis]